MDAEDIDGQNQEQVCLAKKIGQMYICTGCLQELVDALEWKRHAD
jgi:hypothetical protein